MSASGPAASPGDPAPPPPFAGGDASSATPKRSVLDRLRSRPRPDLAIRALESLLAYAAPEDVTPTDLSRALEAYGVQGMAARAVLVQLWKKALASFLADDALTDAEIAYLEQLRRALGLSEAEATAAQSEVVHPRYERALAEVVADQHVSPEERERLERLSAALRLAPDVEREMYAKAVAPLLQAFVEGAVSDQQLSAQERDTFVELMRHLLGIELDASQVTLRTLTRYSLLWRLENEELPTIGAPLALERGERCHLYCRARRVARAPDAAEAVSEPMVRIARGVRYRAGSVAPRPLPDRELGDSESGTLYITNQRVVFVDRAATSIPLDDIQAIGVAPHAVLIEIASGPGPLLVMDEHLELAALILSRVMT